MYSDLFSQKSVQDLLTVLPSLPLAVWETFYVTVVSTALSLVIGLPLGVLLVVGEKNGVLPLPRWLMQVLNVIINLLRSIPFLILMIMVFPLSRLLIGTAVGTTATIVPLGSGVPLCGASGGEQSPRGGRQHHRGRPEHGRYADADHLQGNDPRERTLSGSERDHRADYHSGLLRYERYHRRRRSGQDRHRLRLLPV